MSKRHKKVCRTLNYIEHFPVLASAVTGCVSFSVIVSLVGIPIGIASSVVVVVVVVVEICTITAAIKKYKARIKKKKKKHDKIVLLGKTKLISVDVLISKVLID